MRKYELTPNDSHKSFYGKAIVMEHDSGTRVLYSYGTPIIVVHFDGRISRIWDGWSATTGRHIRAFCGLSKREFLKLPVSVEKW